MDPIIGPANQISSETEEIVEEEIVEEEERMIGLGLPPRLDITISGVRNNPARAEAIRKAIIQLLDQDNIFTSADVNVKIQW